MPKLHIFKNTAIGLNVSDRTVEVIKIAKKDASFIVKAKNRIFLPKGIVEHGILMQPEALQDKVIKLLESAKPHPIKDETITFGLPENQVFTHLFSQPVDTPLTEKIINREAHHTFPIPPKELTVTVKKMAVVENAQEILLTGVSNTAIQQWAAFFKLLGLKVQIHSNTEAIYRGVFQKSALQPVAIINVDLITTAVHFYSEHGLHYSYIIDSGGEQLIDAMVEELNITRKKAEKLLHDEGTSDRRTKSFLAIANKLEPTFASIRDTLRYYEKKYSENVSQIILTGPFSTIKGLHEYAQRFLDMPVEIGFARGIKEPAALSYIEALGLAHIGLFPNEGIQSQPLLVPDVTQEETPKEPVHKKESAFRQNFKRYRALFLLLLFSFIVLGGAFLIRWYRIQSMSNPFS